MTLPSRCSKTPMTHEENVSRRVSVQVKTDCQNSRQPFAWQTGAVVNNAARLPVTRGLGVCDPWLTTCWPLSC